MKQIIHNLKRTIVLLLAAALTCAFVSSQPPDTLDTRLAEAFNAITEAEASGADVTQLIDMMNTAVNLRREGREAEAETLLTLIISDAETARLTGVQKNRVALVKTVEISARVTAIDHANRRVMLLGPNGEKKTVTVGPEAVNFDQVRVGDLVNIRATEELVVGLIPERAAVPEGKAVQSLGYIDTEAVDPMPDGAAGIVALAAKGAQPGGLVAGTMRTTATVVAIDHAMRTAKLEFKDGSTQTFPVRADIDLSRHKVGERVFFQLTEMIAISVEKQ